MYIQKFELISIFGNMFCTKEVLKTFFLMFRQKIFGGGIVYKVSYVPLPNKLLSLPSSPKQRKIKPDAEFMNVQFRWA
jgi:hypothetical protein